MRSRRRWGVSRRTRGGCTTWAATSGSGAPTGTARTKKDILKIQKVKIVEIAVSCAAVRGSTIPAIAGRPTATARSRGPRRQPRFSGRVAASRQDSVGAGEGFGSKPRSRFGLVCKRLLLGGQFQVDGVGAGLHFFLKRALPCCTSPGPPRLLHRPGSGRGGRAGGDFLARFARRVDLDAVEAGLQPGRRNRWRNGPSRSTPGRSAPPRRGPRGSKETKPASTGAPSSVTAPWTAGIAAAATGDQKARTSNQGPWRRTEIG